MPIPGRDYRKVGLSVVVLVSPTGTSYLDYEKQRALKTQTPLALVQLKYPLESPFS